MSRRLDSKRKPAAPSPDKVWAAVEYAREVLLPTIAKEYREAYQYRFGRRDRHSNHLDQTEGKDPERQERVNQGRRVSNPTLAVAADQEWLGDRLRAIAPRIFDIEDTLRSIRGQLGSLFVDPEEEYGRLRRDPIPDAKQTDAQKRGEAFQRKRELEEEEKNLVQALIRVRREMRESA